MEHHQDTPEAHQATAEVHQVRQTTAGAVRQAIAEAARQATAGAVHQATADPLVTAEVLHPEDHRQEAIEDNTQDKK